MVVPFSKYHANGNDFILILSDHLSKKDLTRPTISKLCCRHTGVGADGLFLVSPSDSYDFILDYYNADGSWETLCANGSRCAAQEMYHLGRVKKDIFFLAGDGPHKAKILESGIVAMKMKTPEYRSKNISPGGLNGHFIDSGARHFISESNDLSEEFVLEWGEKIRHAQLFHPKGINVNFYKLIDKNTVKIMTYEKGVEGVMMSCASGSTAVIFHLSNTGLVKSPALVCSSGGNLTFDFDGGWENAWSSGPAQIVFYGNIELNRISK